MPQDQGQRRPIAARGSAWAKGAAQWLATSGVTPNLISVVSIGFALAGAWAMLAPEGARLLAAAVFIQLRLVCNLLDGMVAVEGGMATPTGVLFNEFPDRVADSVLLVAAGYAAGQPWLGWLCALLAALTAYVRLMGGSLGQQQSFRGPMAKQHRMAVLTVALVLAAAAAWGERLDLVRMLLLACMAIIAVGAAWTCVNRTMHIVGQLKGQN